MLLFANYNLAHLLVVFASGCGIGAVVLFVWTRNRQKHQVIQLRNSIRRIKKKLVPQPKSDDNLFDDLINDIFNLKRKSLQREKRFRKVGRRLNSVLNNMDVGVVILDASNTVIFSNKSKLQSNIT